MPKSLRFAVVFLTLIQLIAAQESNSKIETLIQSESIDFKRPLKLCGIYENPQTAENSIASDNENVFVSLITGEIISIDKKSRHIKWKTNLGGRLIRKPVIFNQNLIVLSMNEDNKEKSLAIRLIDKENGLVIWQNSLKEKDIENEIKKDKIFPTESFAEDADFTSVFPYNDRIILLRKHYLLSLNLYDGKIIAEKQIQETTSTDYFIDEEKIIFGTEQKNIFVLSAKDFSDLKKIKISTKPIIVHTFQNDLIWGDIKGNLYKTSTHSAVQKNKKLFRTGGKATSILTVKGNYLITSLDNFTYYISRQKGDILWKRRFASRPENKPLIVGDVAVIQSVGENFIWMVDLNSGNLVNKISLENDDFLVGEVLESSPYILLQTKKSIIFYSYEKFCLQL